jgi:hypothetical protein
MATRRSERILKRENDIENNFSNSNNYCIKTRSKSKNERLKNGDGQSNVSNVSNVSSTPIVNANVTNVLNTHNVSNVPNLPNIIKLESDEVLSDSEFEHDWISISSGDVKEDVPKIDLLSHSEFEDDWISIKDDEEEELAEDIQENENNEINSISDVENLNTLATYESVFEEDGGPDISENISLLTSITDLVAPFLDLDAMNDTASS